jgi:Salmonella virulence plasmid 65kDa B protein
VLHTRCDEHRELTLMLRSALACRVAPEVTMVALLFARAFERVVRTRRCFVRGLVLCMTLVATCSLRPVYGSPGDIFSVGAPMATAEAPKQAAPQDGDTSVSSQTGAFQYGYPIRVPPGRKGVEPHLQLSYSSQGAIYGGLAAGWSLAIPAITLDTTKGRLWTTALSITVKDYVSSLPGGRRLLGVSEPATGDVIATYRAQNDSTFTRYQRMNASVAGFQWRALGKDGTTYFFGDSDHIGSCTIVSDEWAPLTRSVDSFGNSVDYLYEAGADSECRIHTIRWGHNGSAGLSAFAGIDFNYDAGSPDCNGAPVGAQTSFRTSTKIVTGASKLDSLTITAFSPGTSTIVHTRVITFNYGADTASCSAPHGAFRSLASIQESAWGTDSPRVDLPPVTFTYGPTIGSTTRFYPPRVFDATTVPWGTNAPDFNLGWGRRFQSDKWPTVEAMMLDVDGDGLLDRSGAVQGSEEYWYDTFGQRIVIVKRDASRRDPDRARRRA